MSAYLTKRDFRTKKCIAVSILTIPFLIVCSTGSIAWGQGDETEGITFVPEYFNIDNIPRSRRQADDFSEWSSGDIITAVWLGFKQIHNDEAPKIIYNVGERNSGCGLVTGSMYCPADETIYITAEHIELCYDKLGGDSALAFIVAHEIAHWLQKLWGQTKNGEHRELQADALAGLILGRIPNLFFHEDDVDEMRRAAYHLGDFAFSDSRHHGTRKQRLSALETGLRASFREDGVELCLNKYPASPE